MQFRLAFSVRKLYCLGGVVSLILFLAVLVQYQRLTDGQTDGFPIHGKNGNGKKGNGNLGHGKNGNGKMG